MRQQGFAVTGMSCAACSARVEKVVQNLPGANQVQVNLLTNSMRVVYDEAILSEADIVHAVEKAGYGATPGENTPTKQAADNALKRRFLLSLIFLVPMMLMHHGLHGHISVILQLFLLLPILWLNRKFFISGTKAALNLAPNMDTLIALGAAAGIIYSLIDICVLHSGSAYVDSAGMILTLITLGKWIESRATSHTGDALSRLRELLPRTATIVRHGARVIVEADSVQPGDCLIIEAGARVPVDAQVTEGVSSIDESALTGESMPVVKENGSLLYAGTINGNGILHATATHTRQASALSGIIHMVGEAAATKAPISRLADRISTVFVPAVVLVSVATACIWLLCGASLSFSLGCAIAVLVVSCPCALGLATPVAIMAGAGIGAERGILFRDGATMEDARRTTAIILDKTGTLTSGNPVIVDITPAEKVTKNTLLQLACTLEHNSLHPLAQSIRKATSFYTPQHVSKHEYRAGRGIIANVDGIPAAAGNAELMRESGVTLPETEHDNTGGMTPLYFAQGGKYMGRICVADPIKAGSAAAVATMKAAGLRVLMMSGDHEGAVAAIASQAGIDEYYAGVKPEDKAAMVSRLRQEGNCVAMVGDGINDAPALTRADVGIAIGAGTDVAIESAGIILVRSELQDAVTALQLSRAVIRTIRQNLFWAFFYNLLTIPLAAGLYYPVLGWQLSPAIAAAAMSLSSLFVVCNALRLRRQQLLFKSESSMNTITISVKGMMCPHCERHVTQALSAIPDITEVKADHKSATVTLTCSAPVEESIIAAAVQQAGYEFRGIGA